MNKLRLIAIAAVLTISGFISSCSYNPGSNNPQSTATLNFKKDFHANYDVAVVDTADKNGNNADKIIGVTQKVQDIITDTNLTYQSKNHVTKIITYHGTTPFDSSYFYQDPNGDLYRYNFGFSILNQFTYLTQAIGSPVDVGWVLAAKMGSAAGTTWVARTDSVLIQSFNLTVYLTSQGVTMNDTTFLVGTESIVAHHMRNTMTATAAGGLEHGNVVIDSYYSTDINAVVEDFFRHVTLSGSLLNQQAQGSLKIMTSHY